MIIGAGHVDRAAGESAYRPSHRREAEARESQRDADRDLRLVVQFSLLFLLPPSFAQHLHRFPILYLLSECIRMFLKGKRLYVPFASTRYLPPPWTIFAAGCLGAALGYYNFNDLVYNSIQKSLSQKRKTQHDPQPDPTNAEPNKQDNPTKST